MSQAPSVAFAAPSEEPLAGPAGHGAEPARACGSVSLRGTTRGLEILIAGTPPIDALRARLTALLAEAPSFFAGCDARVAFDGGLPAGALACLEDVAAQFELRLVEIGPVVARRRRPEVPRVLRPEDLPLANLAEGTGPVAEDALPAAPARHASELVAAPASHASGPAAVPASHAGGTAAEIDAVASSVIELVAEPADAAPPGPRLVIGPVRCGVIVDHPGHLIVVGDVNPGAEVRAEGSIIVLGRLRGVAHAAIAGAGFIIALSLQPQQLRIGRMVARAADADRPGDGAEIAYVTGETIVVERFWGRLPNGLASGLASGLANGLTNGLTNGLVNGLATSLASSPASSR